MYSNESKKYYLKVSGMTCGHCSMKVRDILDCQGATGIKVDHAQNLASFSSNKNNLSEILFVLKDSGYPSIQMHNTDTAKKLLSSIELKFYFCLLFTLPLLLHMLLSYHWLHNPYVQLALTIPVYLVGLFHFGNSAWGSIKRRKPNMDVLIFIGSTAAFIYSLIGTIFNLGPTFQFYETSATIITLVLMGNVLEHVALKKTTSAIEELNFLRPSIAHKIDEQNNVFDIDISEVSLNDILLVNIGEKVPTDGVIVSGEGELDESMITGESLPVYKSVSQSVVGSSLLSSGSIQLKVTATGENTILSSIIRLVEDSVGNKPKIQEFADKVSNIFVPVIALISLGTLLISYLIFDISLTQSLMQAIAVLVISCPCAMGLATPAAVVVGVGNAARKGILVKGGKALELLSNVKSVVFDKTGTITTGHFKISKFVAKDMDAQEAKSIIVALETHSTHPIAQSLLAELKGTTPFKLKKIEETKGIGMTGSDFEGNTYHLGGKAEKNSPMDIKANIFLSKNGHDVAAIELEDEIRSDALEVFNYLSQRGIETVLLSGDRKNKCDLVGKALNIKTVFSEKTPAQKLEIIREINRTSTLAYVGDGINDAPALAEATVGISFGTSSESAIQSAEIILLNNNLSSLISSFKLADQTFKTIKQNLFWALGYNVIAVPIAAMGFLNPMLGAFTMAFSDVIVIANSLRLKFAKLS